MSARRLLLAALISMLASLAFVPNASAARYVDLVNATPGVTGYWRLGELSGTVATAQKGPAGTYVASPTLGLPGLLASDTPNFAAGFSGTTSGPNVSIADGVHADFSTAYTLEAWVRIGAPAAGTTNYVMCKEGAYSIRLNAAGDWEGVARGTASQLVDSNPEDKPVAGQTYHVVTTFDGAWQRLYVNGRLADREVATGPITDTTSTLNIGSCRSYDMWDGTIDEPAVYNVALDAATVREHYETGADGTPPPAAVGVKATAGDREVTIDWQGSAADDVASYRVYRATSLGSVGSSGSSPVLTTTEWTDTGRVNGTEYEYWIHATDSRGNVGPSSARVRARPTASTRYRGAVLGNAGIQGYWRLGESSGTAARATVGDDGTIAGGPAMGAAGLLLGDSNTAMDFDGVDDQVTIADSDRVDGSSVVSFEAWVRPDARTTADGYVVAKSGAYHLSLRPDGIPEARVVMNAGVAVVAVGTAPLALGQTYHLVGTFDRQKIRLYVNGALVSEPLLGGDLMRNANPLQIGALGTGSRFNGVIDEVAVYDTTLSAAEVKDRFDAGRPSGAPAAPSGLVASAGDGLVSLDWSDNAETNLVGYDVYRKGSGGAWTRLNKNRITASRYVDYTAANGITSFYMVKAANRLGLASAASATVSAQPRPASSYRQAVATAGASSLRGYWRLGETRGGVAEPEHGQEGDYVNSPSLGQTGLLRGDTDKAPDFQAADQDHMRVPDHAALDVSTAFTLETWMRQDTTPADQRYIVCKYGAYSLRVSPLNDLEAVMVNSAGTAYVAKAAVKPVNGTSYHLATTYDGVTLRIYVNGALSGSVAATGTVAATTNNLFAGTCGGGQWWDGVVDEPALYGTALSAAQITEHHDIGADGTPPAAPTSVAATPGDRQVALNWAASAATDLSGYEVLRSTSSGGPLTKVSERLTTSAFTDTDLENGKTHYYRVRAVDKAGNASANSSEVPATPTTSPVLAAPDTKHADGAELRWNRFDPAVNGTFSRYEVHRSTTAGFTPSSSTLLASIPDRMITTYRDTTAGAGKTYTYKLTVNGRATSEWTVALPVNGESKKVLQPDATTGSATYVREGTCANRGADSAVRIGTTAQSKVRGLIRFDVSDIPSDATITNARVSLHAAEAPTVGATIAAHRATTAWEEGDGNGTCDADGASWTESQAGDPWSVAGGDFAASAEGSVARAAGSALGWDDYVVTDLVRRWVSGEAPNFGVVLKATDETPAAGKLVTYHGDGATTPASVRPRLIVDYADGSRTSAPQVKVTGPVGGDLVKGSQKVTADAGDDRKVSKVDFYAGATLLGTDTAAPYEVTWNSTAAANGSQTLKAVATDDVGNTTEDTLGVSVGNSSAPTTSVDAPATGYASAVKADNPIAYYRLGEAPGATVMNDSSGNARHGSYIGTATTLGQAGLTRDGDTAAKVTQTVSGGPRTSALSAAGVSSSSQLSVETWMDFQGIAVDTYDHVVERGWSYDGYWATSTGRWIIFTTDWGNDNEVVCFNLSKAGVQHGACAPIPRGRLHVTGTYDGSTIRIFLDGTLVESVAATGITLNTTTEIRIAEGGTQDQKIDDVALYNTALGPADVQQHYDATGVDSYVPTVQADVPAGYWRFGETSGTTIADSSGAGRGGTLSGDVVLGQGSLLGRPGNDTSILFRAPGSDPNDGVATINGLSGLMGARMTAEAWIDYEGPTEADEWMHLMSRGWGSPGGWKIAFYSCWDGCGEQGSGFFVNQGGTVLRAVTNIDPGRLHVAATYDGSLLRYYLNGGLIATENVVGLALNTTAPLLIGGSINTGNQIGVDEAAVYDKVLTDQDIREHYIAGRARAIAGDETIKASAADDGSVSEVQFYVDGHQFETVKAAPYQANLSTLAATDPTYDGPHVLTTKVVDNHGNVTTSAPENVVVANSSPGARAHIAAESVDQTMTYDPAAGNAQQTQTVDVSVTNLGDRTLTAADTDLRYRWIGPDGSTVSTGDKAFTQSAVPHQTIEVPIDVPAPPLDAGVESAQHELQFDLVDTSAAAPVVLSTRGNKPGKKDVGISLPDSSLGLERWHNYHGEELGGGMQHLVNVASGNGIVRWTPFESPGRGLSTVVDMTYNGLERKERGAVGTSWSLSISSLTRFGEPLDVHPSGITLVDGDGTEHKFVRKVAADNVEYWEEPAGVHLYLREYSTTDSARRWAITRPDRTTFFFDKNGWPTSVEDNNGNRITFTVVPVAPAEDPGGPKFRITKVTDAGGRAFDLTYWSKATAASSHIRGKVKRITDHTGSALDFDYYHDGNLLRITQQGELGGNLHVPDRTWVFTYTDSNGDAPALTATERANPPAKVGPQSHAIYSVRDPNGKDTTFEYVGSGNPNVRWRTKTRFNRANEKTSFGYDDTNDVTTVTAPLAPPGPRLTKYDYDAKGQVTRITDPANRQTSIVWNPDRHVASVTEPGNAGEPEPRLKEFDYDANGYITRVADKSEAIDRTTTLTYDHFAVDGKDVLGKWRAGRNVGHISRLKTVVRPKLNTTTFAYDENQTCTNPVQRDNLTSVTDAESSKTKFDYNCDGTIKQVTDPRNNVTTYTYDANGLPSTIQEPATELARSTFTGNAASTALETQQRTTRFAYDGDGLLQWVQDPNHASEPASAATCDGPEDARDYRTCIEYDNFDRPRRQSSPKSTAHERDELLWTGLEYDPNDNVTQSFAPAKGQAPVNGNPFATNTYDPMDRLTSSLGPDDETRDGGSVVADLTTVRYDAAGRPDRITLPLGNHTPASDTDHAVFLGYDVLDRVTSETRFADGSTFRQRFCFDTAGDLRSVTRPMGDPATHTCNPYGNGTHTWKMEYFRDHRRKRVIDPENKARSLEYDANGNVSKRIDAQNTPTTIEYNGRDDVTKVVQRFDATRTLTSKTEYDAAGNVIRSVTPRAWSKAPDLASYDGREYVASYTYDALNRPTRVQLPDDATTTQAYVHKRYDANGNLTLRTQPTKESALGSAPDDEKVRLGYFDPGWVRSKDEGPLATVRFDYRAEGWQTERRATGANGRTSVATRRYFKDGMLAERDGRDAQTNEYEYDIHNNVVSATANIGVHDASEPNKTLKIAYDGLDRPIDTREQRGTNPGWRVSTLKYNANNQIVEQLDNATATAVDAAPTGGRRHTYGYLTNDWLNVHNDFGTDPLADDDRKTELQHTDNGRVKKRILSRWANGAFAVRQTTDLTFSLNDLPLTMRTYKGSDTTAIRERHDLEYFNGTEFLNGNRFKDTFVRSGPDTGKKCLPAGGNCVREFGYDAQDRVKSEVLRYAGTGQKTRDYTLSPAGNLEKYTVDSAVQFEQRYKGTQLVEQLDANGQRIRWYRYDPFGNLDCVTKGTEDQSVCETWDDPQPSPELVEHYRYDDLERMRVSRKFLGGVARKSETTYDVLDRPVKREETVVPEKLAAPTTTRNKTTSLTYRGLTKQVSRETRKWSAPVGATDPRWRDVTRDFSYSANGARSSMTSTRAGGTAREFTYGYDPHGSISLLLDDQGDARGSYGYTAYGQAEDETTAERDLENAGSQPFDEDPTNPYGYGDKRTVFGAGTLDMGARQFSPDTTRFLQDDMYEGALADVGLSNDPLTSNRYALAGGNPVSFVESDGHEPVSSFDRDGSQPMRASNGDVIREATPESVQRESNDGPDRYYQNKEDQEPLGGYQTRGGGQMSDADGRGAAARNPGRWACQACDSPAERERKAKEGGIITDFLANAASCAVDETTMGAADLGGDKDSTACTLGRVGTYLNPARAVVGAARAGGKKLLKKGGDDAAEGGAKACNCFPAGTRVSTARGSKPIEKIKVGDRVWARDLRTGELRLRRVVSLFSKRARSLLTISVAGTKLEVTPEHPMWVVGRGWTEAGDLREGDELSRYDGSAATIVSIRSHREAVTVYNFEVEEDHNYYVSEAQLLVHNCQELTPWGWTGGAKWRDAVRRVGQGGEIREIDGAVPSVSQAKRLIEEAGGTITRGPEGPHRPPNPIDFYHFNYTTAQGNRGHLAIAIGPENRPT